MNRLKNENIVIDSTQEPEEAEPGNNHLSGLNISSTYRGRRTKASAHQQPKRVLMFGTGMNEQEKTRLSQLAAKLKLQVAKEMNNNGKVVVKSEP